MFCIILDTVGISNFCLHKHPVNIHLSSYQGHLNHIYRIHQDTDHRTHSIKEWIQSCIKHMYHFNYNFDTLNHKTYKFDQICKTLEYMLYKCLF